MPLRRRSAETHEHDLAPELVQGGCFCKRCIRVLVDNAYIVSILGIATLCRMTRIRLTKLQEERRHDADIR